MSLEYQIYDFLEDHEMINKKDSDESSEESSEVESPVNKPLPKYIIHSFGRTEKGKSVYAKIINYTPYFYIKLPQSWKKKKKKKKIKMMKKWLISKDNRKVWERFKSGLEDIDLVERKMANGFTNDKLFFFGRIIFNNNYSMKKYRLLFEENYIYIPQVTEGYIRFRTFEANLPPMLRCFHIKKISGCSWISVDK